MDQTAPQTVRKWVKQTSITTLDFKTLDEILDRGHAECRGYSLLFVALCRAADVPARPVWGLTKLPGNEKMPKGDLASHTLCEVYANGGGWVPVDPQTPETFGLLPTCHIRIFMDERKSKTSQENLPVVNLVVMNGETLTPQLKDERQSLAMFALSRAAAPGQFDVFSFVPESEVVFFEAPAALERVLGDKSFTEAKMKRRLERIDESIARYLSQLETADRHGDAVPEANDPLESIYPTREQNPCEMKA